MSITTLAKYSIIVSAMFFLSNMALNGQALSEDIAYRHAKSFLHKTANNNYTFKFNDFQKIIKNNIVIAFVYQLNPQGFIIVSSFEQSNPIVGYSLQNNFSFDENNLNIVSSIIPKTSIKNISQPQIICNRNTNNTTVEPLIKSLFGQVNCYDKDDNLINVANLYTPKNYAPGCVAISLSTLLNYYKWPITGMGSHTYNDISGSSNGVYTADFENTNYDWANILERYRYKQSTQTQREALGELVYHAAVALEMDFEYNGSTSNINRIPNAGKDYFRFVTKQVSATSPIFWKTVDSNLVHNIPIILSISASNGAGHSIVCDGFKYENNDEYHHVNMGWWGTSNGWYKIKNSFNVAGYNKIDHGLINFLPVPMTFEPELLNDSTQLLISWLVSEKITPDVYEIQYKTDATDWKSITDTLKTASFLLEIDENIKEYQFRIRSKIEGKWYSDSWSNIVKYKKNTSSTINILLEDIGIKPNPFTNSLTLELKGIFKVQIFSIEGKLMYQNNSVNNEITIPSSQWNKGIYILKINKANKIKYKKMIKV